MKYKILALFQWGFALFFSSILIGAIIKGNIPIPVDESDFGLVVFFIGLGCGFLMVAIAIYVLYKLGIKNWKK